ncbi:MAG: hypothetical protein PVH37_02895 [Desulfobacterales bacterium]|jgi:hypothetical protein
MSPYKVYYWHVVARTSGGNIEGPYWWFETTDSPSKPLLYWPVAPCRIVDTRRGAGIIGASVLRNFRVFGSGSVLAPQGGDSGEGAGLSVNYNTIDTNLANAGTVKTATGAGPDISVASNFSSAHTVIDVLGYYYSAPSE